MAGCPGTVDGFGAAERWRQPGRGKCGHQWLWEGGEPWMQKWKNDRCLLGNVGNMNLNLPKQRTFGDPQKWGLHWTSTQKKWGGKVHGLAWKSLMVAVQFFKFLISNLSSPGVINPIMVYEPFAAWNGMRLWLTQTINVWYLHSIWIYIGWCRGKFSCIRTPYRTIQYNTYYIINNILITLALGGWCYVKCYRGKSTFVTALWRRMLRIAGRHWVNHSDTIYMK